jgi:hypothetical protein
VGTLIKHTSQTTKGRKKKTNKKQQQPAQAVFSVRLLKHSIKILYIGRLKVTSSTQREVAQTVLTVVLSANKYECQSLKIVIYEVIFWRKTQEKSHRKTHELAKSQ